MIPVAPGASFAEEDAGVLVITANPDGQGIALREAELDEVRTLASSTEGCEFDPRILIVVFGLQSSVPLEGRFELAVLRVLASASWCKWVDVDVVSRLSTDANEVGVICAWLQAARVNLRLAAHNLILTPSDAWAIAERLISLEDSQGLF